MHWLALGTALLVALAIIAIGSQYVASPLAATRSFGHFLRTTPTSLGGFASRGARHRIGVGCTGVREVERAQRGRPHPACGSHHPRRRHASHSRSERLHQKRLRHSRSHGRAYGLGGHASDDWNTRRWCMLFQSGSLLPVSLAQASSTRSARPGRKAISPGEVSRGGGTFLLVGDNKRRSDCASCQSRCWPCAWDGNHCGSGFDRSTSPRFFAPCAT